MKKLGLILCAASLLFGQENCIRGVPSHASARYRGPEGVGYGRGYTTLEGFLTPNWQRGFQPFLDVRGHMFDSGRAAANVGMGGRFNVFGNWAAGANLFYDFRDAKRLRVHQLGSGLELLSPFIDFRLNGYFPIANAKKLEDLTFDRFTGVGNQLIATRQFTAAPANVAFEVGAPLGPFLDPYLSVGPYYLFRRSVDNVGCAGVWGGLARLGLQVFDGISIGGEISYDKEYKTRGNGFVSLSYPLGPNTIRRHGSKWSRWYASPECNDRAVLQRVMTKDVVRQEIIPICSKAQEFRFALDCLFVDGNAPAGGNGTFEFPFNDLSTALAVMPCQCVYVLGGTFTGAFTPNSGCPLLGAGCDQEIPTLQGFSISLPPLNTSYPVLTNPGGNILLTTDAVPDIFVRGFELRNSDTQIGSLLATGGTMTISCNRFTQSQQAIAVLFGALDSIIIDDNEFEIDDTGGTAFATVSANNITITNNSFTSLPGTSTGDFDVRSQGDTIIITGNTARAFNTSGAVFDVFEIAPLGHTSLIVSNNDLESNGPLGALFAVFTVTSGVPLATSAFTNNRIINLTGPNAVSFSNSVGSDNITYQNNTSGLTNAVLFDNTVAGPTVCVSLDSNIAGSYDFTAAGGSEINVNETLGAATAGNIGTITTSGTINFGTGCTPP